MADPLLTQTALAPRTRAGLNLMGLWTVLMEAEAALTDCAGDLPPDKSTIRWRAAELRGAAEVLLEIADHERDARRKG